MNDHFNLDKHLEILDFYFFQTVFLRNNKNEKLSFRKIEFKKKNCILIFNALIPGSIRSRYVPKVRTEFQLKNVCFLIKLQRFVALQWMQPNPEQGKNNCNNKKTKRYTIAPTRKPCSLSNRLRPGNGQIRSRFAPYSCTYQVYYNTCIRYLYSYI